VRSGPTATLRALSIGQCVTVPLSKYHTWWSARDRVIHFDNYNVTWTKTPEGYVLCRIA
jgi:hypothetical protein